MYNANDIIGESKSIKHIREIIKKIGESSSSVFIYGETGTGKELVVQAIHNSSKRKDKPFIAQNCAAIPENLLESIFFGVGKGGFTGAVEGGGLFEAADGGTLYLDELNSMDISFQGKLLRVLQEGEIRRIGDNKIKKVDVRIIASVNEPPENLMKEKKLRADLYYRLNVVRINLPSLNERKDDVPILINHFIKKFNHEFNGDIKGVDERVLSYLVQKDYGGNVRELEHIIEGAFNCRKKGYLSYSDLDIFLDSKIGTSLKKKLESEERKYINEALIICNYNVSKAAKFLDIPRQTLQYKITKYGIK